jgi:ATP-dependent Clp protease adaptor protein ClpS
MSAVTPEVERDVAATVGETRVKPRPRTDTRPKPQPPHAVILHNDPINGFDYVIGVLRKVFRYNGVRAFWLTLVAHTKGTSLIWSGTLEHAELKADQVRSCGPDPKMTRRGAQQLTVSVEPLPE